MKKASIPILCAFALLALPTKSFSQTTSASVSGSINIPALHTIEVSPINEKPLDFSSIEDYRTGKELPNYCRVTVKCNYPWTLSALLNSNSIMQAYNAEPQQFMFFKLHNDAAYKPLTGTPVHLLSSENSSLKNEYIFDARIMPDLKFKDGTYLMDITFVLAPQ